MSGALPVVRPGDRVAVVGTVVRTSVPGAGVGLADDSGPGPVLPDLVHPPISVVVPIVGPPGHERAWGGLVGRRARARAIWTGEGLVCDPGSDDVTFLDPLPSADLLQVAGPELRTPAPARDRAVEGPLFESGDLIWRLSLRRDGAPVVLAAAHDAAAVESALRPLHGEALEVVQSPWPPEEYVRADRFGDRAEALGLLISVEQGLDLDDGVVRYVIRLTALTEDLAAEYRTLPPGLAALETFVAPWSGATG